MMPATEDVCSAVFQWLLLPQFSCECILLPLPLSLLIWMLSLSAGSPCSPRILHLLKWRLPPPVVLRLSSSLPAFRLFVPSVLRPLRTWLSGSGGRGSTLPNLWPSGAWAGGRGGSPDLIDVSQLVLFGRKTRMMSLAAIREALQLYKRRT